MLMPSIICVVPTLLVLAHAEVLVNPVAVECVDESAFYQSTYHAPPRKVPFQQGDRMIRRGFLELFRRKYSPNHNHGSAQDLDTLEAKCLKNSISQGEVDRINDLLSREDTLNSFSDRNLEAVGGLQKLFMSAETPAALLVLAKEQLHRHTFNQKVWYYALIQTLLTRPDLNGTLVAWPIDATPDLYVTHTILRRAREGSSGHERIHAIRNCTTAGRLFYTEVRYQPSSTAPQDVSGASALAQQQGQGRRKRGYGGWGSIGLDIPNEAYGGYGGYNGGANGGNNGGNGGNNIDDDFKLERDNCSKLRNPDDEDDEDDPEKKKEPVYVNLPFYESQEKWKQGWDYHYSDPWQPQQSFHTVPFSHHASQLPYGILFRKKRAPQAQTIPSPSISNQSNNPGTGAGTNDTMSTTTAKPKRKERECILYNGTTGTTDEENRLWYFREDMMLNQHHWYWHQYYPKIGPNTRDRRGEIFFFAHHTIVARYNAERLSVGLPLETPLEFREGASIGPGYFSDLIDENTGRFWTLRLENAPLSDILQKGDRNYGFNMRINDVANAFSTITHHVRNGYLLVNRTDEEVFPLNIKNQDGLNHLGNTVEEHPRYSTNRDLYQSIHSLGHLAISVATDPDFRCKLLKGVMSDVAVAMRDPAFFKVHSLVDILYSDHKSTLHPYQIHGGEWPLQWDGVRLQSLEVITGNGKKINYVQTHWSIKRFPLEEGIDGSIHEGEVKVDICHQHLNHEPFAFKLIVDVDSCAKTVSNKGTVRIFMAPRFNLDGRRFTMEESRHLMFQLDAFPVELHRGRNVITRNSWDSSATKPWSRTLTEMLADPDNGGETDYCGCGWPRHLYIPKGSPQGMEFDFFAMVTNYDDDQVLEPPESMGTQEPCNSPYIYCGRPYKLYPDARPMGYPFDRVPYSVYEHKHILGGYGEAEVVKVLRPVHYLEEYVTHVSSMQSSVVLIQHVDKVIQDSSSS